MKLLPAYETDLYESDKGYICIKQTAFDGESLVMLTPGQAKLLRDYISRFNFDDVDVIVEDYE